LLFRRTAATAAPACDVGWMCEDKGAVNTFPYLYPPRKNIHTHTQPFIYSPKKTRLLIM
jgi:hypothetical protein